ncbi:MAG: hypothetical protein ABIK09_16315 [Pseudomonadota bacterium]
MKRLVAKKSLVLVALLAMACMVGLTYAADTPTAQPVQEKGSGLVQDASKAVTTAAARAKGRDGAACSSNDECESNVCEGGSCCTAHGAPCDSASHCCGHQSCTSDKCPE